MQIVTKELQQYRDWDNQIRFNSAELTDIEVVNIACQANMLAYKHFKELDNISEGYKYEYEGCIANIALAIDGFVRENKQWRKSEAIKQFALDVMSETKYANGRGRYIELMGTLKMDNELRKIASDNEYYWYQARIRFSLIYTLYKRSIIGFEHQATKMLELAINNKDTEIKRYAKKYLEMSEHKRIKAERNNQ